MSARRSRRSWRRRPNSRVRSFLGLGVQPPMASLGTLIATGAQDMEMAPWLLIFPSLTMVVTLMAFNFIGDGLRDALDPKDR
eukprot:gene34431-46195_t